MAAANIHSRSVKPNMATNEKTPPAEADGAHLTSVEEPVLELHYVPPPAGSLLATLLNVALALVPIA